MAVSFQQKKNLKISAQLSRSGRQNRVKNAKIGSEAPTMVAPPRQRTELLPRKFAKNLHFFPFLNKKSRFWALSRGWRREACRKDWEKMIKALLKAVKWRWESVKVSKNQNFVMFKPLLWRHQCSHSSESKLIGKFNWIHLNTSSTQSRWDEVL